MTQLHVLKSKGSVLVLVLVLIGLLAVLAMNLMQHTRSFYRAGHNTLTKQESLRTLESFCEDTLQLLEKSIHSDTNLPDSPRMPSDYLRQLPFAVDSAPGEGALISEVTGQAGIKRAYLKSGSIEIVSHGLHHFSSASIVEDVSPVKTQYFELICRLTREERKQMLAEISQVFSVNF